MDFSARLAGLKILARFENTGLGFSARADLRPGLNPSPCNRQLGFLRICFRSRSEISARLTGLFKGKLTPIKKIRGTKGSIYSITLSPLHLYYVLHYLMFLRSKYENATPNLCWVFCALLGVLCIVGCPVQLIREVFRDCIFVVDTLLPRFEALGYVLPHFDELTHVAIRGSSAFISPAFC